MHHSQSGLSPLHEAAELGSEDMILLFCQLPGLDTQVKDNVSCVQPTRMYSIV